MKPMSFAIVLFFSVLAAAEKLVVLNVFYNYRLGSLSVNLVDESMTGKVPFLRTNRVTLRSSKIPSCDQGCSAQIIDAGAFSMFFLVVGDVTVAKINTNDSDNLLPSEAFRFHSGDQKILEMDLDILSENHKVGVEYLVSS